MFSLSVKISVLIFYLVVPVTGLNAQTKTGEENSSNLVGHGGPIKAISIDASGQFVLTGSFDYSAGLWSLDDQSSNKLIRHYSDHDGAVNAVAFVEGGEKFVSAGDDGSIYLWSTSSDKLLFRFEGHAAKVISLAVSKDGKKVATASWDRTVGLWDLENKKTSIGV